MEVLIKQTRSGSTVPKYNHENDAGVDLRACIGENQCWAVLPGEISKIPTGIALGLPKMIEAQVRSRSGLASKGICVANSPGTIDPSYVGEIFVLLENRTKEVYWVNHGDRIAQIVFASYLNVEFTQINELNQTNRGSGGFGSTGIK